MGGGHRALSSGILYSTKARRMMGGGLGGVFVGKMMRDAGASTLGQDESSSVVYGMPRVAFEIGAVERQAPLERLGPMVLNLCNLDRRERA